MEQNLKHPLSSLRPLKLWSVLLFTLIFIGCRPQKIYIPLETIKIEKELERVHDTLIQVKLVPYYARTVVTSDSSHLENQYAFTNAHWDGTFLHHDLGIKDKDIAVTIQYVDRWHFKSDSIPYAVEVAIKGDTIFKMKWYEQVFFYLGMMSTFILGFVGLFRFIRNRFLRS